MDLLHLEKAITLRDSGHLSMAEEEFRQLLVSANDPGDKTSILHNLAECYREMGQIEKAWGCIREARRIAPQTEILLYQENQEALLLCEDRQFREALDKLERFWKEHHAALERPEHRTLYEAVQLKRGVLLAEFGRDSEARPILEQALGFELPTEAQHDVAFNLGACYLDAGEFARAKEMFIAALKHRGEGPYAIRAHYNLGIICLRDQAFAQAIHEFEQCEPNMTEANLSPDFVYGWLAKAWRALGDDEKAKHFEKLAKF